MPPPPPPPLPRSSTGGGSSSILASLGWLALGTAVGVALTVLNVKTEKNSIRHRRPKKRLYQISEPRGVEWELTTRDWEGWDKMPTSFDAETQLVWGTLPVHSTPQDPFHKQENFVEALVKSTKLSGAEQVVEQITRDTPRTFPEDSFFADADVQDSLIRVLTAVAMEYPNVGYGQGMNFIGAFLLLHAKTEDGAFCLFMRLMSHPRLRLEAVYRPGLPLLLSLVQALDQLLMRHTPAEYGRLKLLGIDTLMFAQNWLMTLFTYSMDWQAASKIWDAFFKSGWPEVLRVCVFLVRTQHNQLVDPALDFETAFVVMKNAAEDAPENVMELATGSVVFDDTDILMIETALPEIY